MLWECGQEDIPVAVGRPTRGDSNATNQLNWGDGFERLKPVRETAADFIIDTLRKYPGEVTIISVGPVTNLADAIRKDPEAWKLVKEVYSMFGSFYVGYNGDPTPHPEWNVVADVESAKVFMTSGVPIILAGPRCHRDSQVRQRTAAPSAYAPITAHQRHLRAVLTVGAEHGPRSHPL